METQPEQPEVKKPEEESALEDTPITVSEVTELMIKEAIYIKDSVLAPVWRLGRRYLKSIEEGGDAIAEGLTGKKRKDR